MAVLTKEPIDATLIDEYPDIECLCIKVSCWGHSFVFVACYRPSDATPDYMIKLKEYMSPFRHKIFFS